VVHKAVTLKLVDWGHKRRDVDPLVGVTWPGLIGSETEIKIERPIQETFGDGAVHDHDLIGSDRYASQQGQIIIILSIHDRGLCVVVLENTGLIEGMDHG
jgi:hypothetical protein